MRKVLAGAFFGRSALVVAPQLLGKFLVRREGDREIVAMITEVEAYAGEEDLACHASRGRTARTEVMYAQGGVWYVYLVYGMHEMLNIVTGLSGNPHAVLIRGVEGVNGPGRVTKAFGIGRAFNKKSASRESRLWIEDRGVCIPKKDIERTPRIGVAYAKEWAQRPWRFVVKKKPL